MKKGKGIPQYLVILRRRVHPAMAVVCAMSLMCLLLALPAIAVNPPPAGNPPPGDGNGPQLNDRAVNVSVINGVYVVRSSTVINGTEDSFKVELGIIGEDLELALKYKESAPESEHRIDVTLKFRNLIEFDDRNGNGKLDTGEEVLTYKLDNRSLGRIEYRTENGGAGPIYVLSISTLDQVFSMRFYMTGELTPLMNQDSPVNVTPSEVKFDINIRNFPFRQNASRLALDGQLITRETLQFDNQTIDEKLKVADDESGCLFNDQANLAGAFLSWANWALVDGERRPIQMDIPAAELANETKRLIINYPRGAGIFHDPRMGIVVSLIGYGPGPTNDDGNDWAVWAWTLGTIAVAATVITMISVAVVVDRRRFRKESSRRDPFELRDYPHYRGKR